MASGKKNKKNNQLSSLDKLFFRALRTQSLSPTEAKDAIKKLKEDVRYLQTALGIKRAADEPVETPQNKDLLAHLRAPENLELNYAVAVKSLVLNEWYNNKIVYEITPELLEYVKTSFPDMLSHLYVDKLVSKACERPIMLRFPYAESIKGIFCGASRLFNDQMVADDGLPMLVYFVVGDNESPFIRMHKAPNCNLIDLEKDGLEPACTLCMKLLIYIGFMMGVRDADGLVFQKARRQTYTACNVFPPPPGVFPDLKSPLGWISAGLAPYVGYLSRDSMAKALEAEIKEYWDAGPHDDDDAGKGMVTAAKQMILEWEKDKTVYQLTAEVEEKITYAGQDELLLCGYSQQLLSYMPAPTVAILQKDSGTLTLARSGIDFGQQEHILFARFNMDSGFSICAFPANGAADSAIIYAEKPSPEGFAEPLCVLRHILKVYEQRTLKKMQKDLLSQGRPDTRAMVPVEYYEPRQSTPADGKPEYRYGPSLALEDDFVRMFDLTPRTVKKVRQERLPGAPGTPKDPHYRRGHMHRYWVGSGEDKQLITRWVERVHVNGKKGLPKTTKIKNVQ